MRVEQRGARAAAEGWLICALALGCGGGPPPVSIEEHPAALAQAVCATLFRCCSPSLDIQRLEAWVGMPPDQAFCEEAVRNVVTSRATFVAASVEGGRSSYDPSHTAACIASLRDMSCEEFSWNDSRFRTYVDGCWSLSGKVPTGGGCLDNFECAGGGACRAVAGGGVAICALRNGAGSPCVNPVDCKDGLACLNRVCTDIGDPKGIGSSCTAGIQCRSLRCEVSDNGRQACAPVPACGLM
jgi:hypothetical protein